MNAEHTWLKHIEAILLMGGALVGVIAFAIRNALRLARLEWQVGELWNAHKTENGKIDALWIRMKEHEDATNTPT